MSSNSKIMRLFRNFLGAESKLKWLLSKFVLLLGINAKMKIPIFDGLKIYLHPSKMSVWFFISRDFKKEELAFYRDFLREGEVFVDVGANIGALSLVAAKKVGEHGHVHAVEAIPFVRNYLQQNVELNGLQNTVSIYGCALGDENKTGVEFYTRKYGDDLGSLSGAVHHANGTVEVEMKRGETLFSHVPEVTLLKIDVEGAEYLVLKGFQSMFSKVRFIRFENEKRMFDFFKVDFADIIDLLTSNGFSVYTPLRGALVKVDTNYNSEVRADLFALRAADFDEFEERAGFR